MTYRRKFAALLAATVIATSLPTFAASTNGMSKIVTVAEQTQLAGTLAPELKIELKDDLAQGETFYLELENAQWAEDIATQLNKDADLKDDFNFVRENSTRVSVTVINEEGIKANKTAYRIPMLTQVHKGDAAVSINSNDTVVTAGKYVFATSNSDSGIVTVEDVNAFAVGGKMGKIIIEEPHIGAFQSQTEDKKIRFDLEETGIIFNYNKDVEIPNAFKGQKAYLGKDFDATVIDSTTLEVTIPKKELSASQRGAFILTGIELKADKGAEYGDVNVTVSGDLSDTTQVLVARHRDYGTELAVARDYTATAGQELKNIEFTLSETVADSITGNRETTFSFSEGVTIKDVKVSQSSGIQDGKPAPVASVKKEDGKNTNQFTVESIAADNEANTSITFEATLDVPAAFAEEIKLTVEGRSLERRKEVEIAKVLAPVKVEVTPATVEAGLTEQNGGTVVIHETDKGMLSSGKIFLAMENTDINYIKAPQVKVTEGNLRIEADAKIVEGGIQVTVIGKSTKASTLEISGGELTVNTTVPGTYKVKVGGTAISAYAKDQVNHIDAIAEKDYLYVGSQNTRQKATFVIGESKYTVDGVEKTMDTASYLAKEGRTMLPVRYVADALGVEAHNILWDNEKKTVTVMADRIVQLKVGSKEMLISGMSIPMTAAAEIKNNRTFIPVAEIARALNANVEWDETTKTATFH